MAEGTGLQEQSTKKTRAEECARDSTQRSRDCRVEQREHVCCSRIVAGEGDDSSGGQPTGGLETDEVSKRIYPPFGSAQCRADCTPLSKAQGKCALADMQAENARLRRRLEKALADLERAQVRSSKPCTARPALLTRALQQVEQEEQHAACALLIEQHESLEWSYNEAVEQVCGVSSPPVVSGMASRA